MATVNFSGIASGIDAASLIQALLDQKRKAQIDPLEEKITKLESTNSAFAELSDQLKTLQTAAGRFREINGGVLAKNLTSSNELALTGSASNAAYNGSYSVSVSALAKNGTHSFDDRFSSGSAVLNSNINNGDPEADRTVSYTIGSGSEEETVDIVLTDSTTAEDFVNEFNSQSTKATASLVNVGTTASPSYAIVVSSNNQGSDKGSIAVSVGARISDPNGDLSTADGSFLNATTSAASNAEFSVSGISGTITRSSNTISDVIEGVTLNLHSIGDADITISGDQAKTATYLQEFVDAYNAVVEFIAENDAVLREESGSEVNNIFGPLASTSLDEGILSTLRGSLSAAGTSGRTVNIFADLGITTARDGTLSFDTEKFGEALAADSEGIRIITQNLGEDLSAVDGKIANYVRFNGLIDGEKNANLQQISDSNDRISYLESMLSREEESLTARFSRLEALIGQLNSQQTALASLLP